jgi:phenylalanyl-tRNA synthetase beta chain
MSFTKLSYIDLHEKAFKTEKSLLKNVTLFDVYEGENLVQGKKSYAVSFHFQDNENTLTDHQIDSIMGKIQSDLESKLNAKLR